MKTAFLTPKDLKRGWYLIDAAGVPLGRVAVKVASLVRGKHLPYFAPHSDLGDRVVVVNADKVLMTGRKRLQKSYIRHTGYPGGLKEESFEHVIVRKPTFTLEQALRGMLPKGPLGRSLFTKVKVYAGSSHPHASQNPQVVTVR
jgi:large subunit ribosomal protein L13